MKIVSVLFPLLVREHFRSRTILQTAPCFLANEIGNSLSVCLVCTGFGEVSSKQGKFSSSQSMLSRLDPNHAFQFTSRQSCRKCNGYGLVPSDSITLPTSNGGLVAICGGGIGGLALALALQHRGINCVVLERDHHVDSRHQGYGLTLQQGARAARALGILMVCRAKGVVQPDAAPFLHKHYLSDGTLLGCHGGTRGDSDGNGSNVGVHKHNLLISRQDLRYILLERLAPGTVRWGSTLRSVTSNESTDRLELHVHDKKSNKESLIHCRVLVGADGIRSSVRSLLDESNEARDSLLGLLPSLKANNGRVDLLPSTKGLNYLGVMVILGISNFSTPDSCVEIFETVNGSARFYSMPFNQTNQMWQLSFVISEEDALSLSSRGPLALIEEAIRLCSRWHEPIPSLIATTDIISGYPIYDREASWAPAGLNREEMVTLLGDAAHPMAPFKGQGANQALLDAVLLANALFDSELGDEPFEHHSVAAVASGAIHSSISRFRRRSSCTIAQALKAYGLRMADRTSPKVHKSREASALLHSKAVLAATGRRETRARAASSVAPKPFDC